MRAGSKYSLSVLCSHSFFFDVIWIYLIQISVISNLYLLIFLKIKSKEWNLKKKHKQRIISNLQNKTRNKMQGDSDWIFRMRMGFHPEYIQLPFEINAAT